VVLLDVVRPIESLARPRAFRARESWARLSNLCLVALCSTVSTPMFVFRE
jgi:hypothetical protein